MADPAAFARKAVLKRSSSTARPTSQLGAWCGRGTLFTFKTYSVSYLELMQRMWNQGGPEGKRAVGWALAMLLLMSGAGGVPFMEDAEDLIDGAGQMMGYNISAAMAQGAAGQRGGQGAGRVHGAGPVWLAGRAHRCVRTPGHGQPAARYRLFLDKPNRERDMTEIIGPAGDLVARGFTGARQVARVWEWDASAGAGAGMGAHRGAQPGQGCRHGSHGHVPRYQGLQGDRYDAGRSRGKAIGFQPKSVAEVQEANSFMQRSKSFYTQTSSDIKAQWADALFRKDEAAVQRVRERLADWNRDNPEQPIVVKMPDVWKRVREMGRTVATALQTRHLALREQMRIFWRTSKRYTST
jgi:hypothetical protein